MKNRWFVVMMVAALAVVLAAGSALALGFGERKMERLDLTEDDHQLLASIRERYEAMILPLQEEMREAREMLDWERFGIAAAALAELRHEMMSEMTEVIPAEQMMRDCGECEQGCDACKQIQRSHRSMTRLMPRSNR